MVITVVVCYLHLFFQWYSCAHWQQLASLPKKLFVCVWAWNSIPPCRWCFWTSKHKGSMTSLVLLMTTVLEENLAFSWPLSSLFLKCYDQNWSLFLINVQLIAASKSWKDCYLDTHILFSFRNRHWWTIVAFLSTEYWFAVFPYQHITHSLDCLLKCPYVSYFCFQVP
jgi:hypothetical protein